MTTGDGDPDAHLVELDRGWAVWRLAALRSAGLPIERLAILTGCGDEPDPAVRRESRTDAFHALLSDDVLLEALAWQNPEAVDTWAGATAAALRAGQRPRTSGSRFGNRFAVLTRYAQRYAAKNDTIGFFGPVAWARLGDDQTGYRGAGGIRECTAYVEVWAVQSIAAAWNADPQLAQRLPVRLDPAVTVTGDTVIRPYRKPYALTAPEAALVAVLRSATGRTTVGELSSDPQDDEAMSLARLHQEGVVQIGFRVPISSWPLDQLERQIVDLPDAGQRIERLESIRRLCRTAANSDTNGEGAAAATRQALTAVSEALDDAAGRPVRREPRFAVGGRTPVYLDCRRDLDATVDDELMADLAGPLSVLLDSARWLCGQVAEVTGDHLADAHRRLSSARAEVTLSDLYLTVADLLEPGGTAFAEVLEDFQLRWRELLGPGDGGNARTLALDDARRTADAMFPPPARTWAAARLHSPDVLLRRRPDGTLAWVVGELHVALNTLESRFFSTQAEDPTELAAAMAADMAVGRVVPLYPSTARDVSSRSYPPLSLDPAGHYRYVCFGSDEGHPSGVAGTPATDIIVEERDQTLIARSRSHGWEAPLLECLGEQLSAAAVNLFILRRTMSRSPRVDLGPVTICRANWRVSLVHVAQVADRAEDPAQRGLRDWLDELGVPRHVFARVPGDSKPFYVDLAAPPLVDNLARAARRSAAAAGPDAEVELVEMLPDPSELWLRLPDGSYTSELRLVARDPQPASPASWPLIEQRR